MTSGPGVHVLARLTGRDATRVATDPGEALRALAELGRLAARVAADRASADPDVRAGAQRRADEIAALVRAAEAEHPVAPLGDEAFRARLAELLTELRDGIRSVAARVERAGPWEEQT